MRQPAVILQALTFRTDLRMTAEHAARPSFREIQKLGEDWEPDLESLYKPPPASRLSMIARLQIGEEGVRNAGFILPFHRARCRTASIAGG